MTSSNSRLCACLRQLQTCPICFVLSAQEPGSHISDAGLVLEPRRQPPAQQTMVSTTQNGLQQHSEPAEAPNELASNNTQQPPAEQEQQQAPQLEDLYDLQAVVMRTMQALYSGMDAVAAGTEAVRQELEAMLTRLVTDVLVPLLVGLSSYVVHPNVLQDQFWLSWSGLPIYMLLFV